MKATIINNKEEWWKLLDEHWDNIRDIIFHHLDPNAPSYTIPGDNKSALTGLLLFKELEVLRDARDPKLNRYLNVSWCMASDTYAYSVPSWSQFCNLCSENWVFEEEDFIPMRAETQTSLVSG